MRKWIFALIIVGLTCGGLTYLNQKPASQPIPQSAPIQKPLAQKPNITTRTPAHLSYEGCVSQIKEWNSQAPDFTTIGTYGKSSRGKDLYYIKVTNKYSQSPKSVILIHGCIHGNEPWATAEVMAWLGNMLGTYGDDKQVTDLIDNNEIYFVPVLSPDSYPNSREVDGVDPNRNFPCPSKPGQSVPPVAAIQDLFNKIKPKAVISVHTFGRIFICPWGDQNALCPNNADYERILGRMCQMSGYGKKRACEVYGQPIYGGEMDWYYRQGALSIVIEVGTHQIKPNMEQITSEFDKTYRAVLYYLEEAPKVR
jgi:hypothetical protein